MVKTQKLFAGMLLAASAALAAQASFAESERYIVKFKAGKGEATRKLASEQGGQLQKNMTKHDAIVVNLSKQAMQAMAKNPNVEFIERDVKRYPLAQETPYGIPMVQADLVGDGLAGNRTVCIIDSGYQLAHEDLSGNNVTGTNDPGTGNWFEDENSHGTHVAGTIAALNNDVGVIGVAPNGNLNLYIVKVFGADGWAYSSSLIDALDVCVENGANVVSMSLGGDFPTRAEGVAFQAAYNKGVLSIAAAGNDGDNGYSYPASYSSVVSVAAIDDNKVLADFSQRNSQVELAGPGVGVVSTVPMGTGADTDVTVDGSAIEAIGMSGSPYGAVSGALVDCGTAEAACTGASGSICLIERGNITFADKVLNCQAGGGVGAIIFNNEPGVVNGTLGDVVTAIPSVGISQEDGAAILGQLPATASISIEQTNYAAFSGTSMATPHVAGVAALVWSHFQSCSNSEIRTALQASAEDLGKPGRDGLYGFGLVQAADAVTYLEQHGCTGAIEQCKGGPKKCPR